MKPGSCGGLSRHGQGDTDHALALSHKIGVIGTSAAPAMGSECLPQWRARVPSVGAKGGGLGTDGSDDSTIDIGLFCGAVGVGSCGPMCRFTATMRGHLLDTPPPQSKSSICYT